MLSTIVDGQEYSVPTVEELRNVGFRVRVSHARNYEWVPAPLFAGLARLQRVVKPKGGATRVLLLAPNQRWAEGIARCSKKDVYSRKQGYALAVDHALKVLGVDGKSPNTDDPQLELESMLGTCEEIFAARPEFDLVDAPESKVKEARKVTAEYFKKTPEFTTVLFAMYDDHPPVPAALQLILARRKKANAPAQLHEV